MVHHNWEPLGALLFLGRKTPGREQEIYSGSQPSARGQNTYQSAGILLWR